MATCYNEAYLPARTPARPHARSDVLRALSQSFGCIWKVHNTRKTRKEAHTPRALADTTSFGGKLEIWTDWAEQSLVSPLAKDYDPLCSPLTEMRNLPNGQSQQHLACLCVWSNPWRLDSDSPSCLYNSNSVVLYKLHLQIIVRATNTVLLIAIYLVSQALASFSQWWQWSWRKSKERGRGIKPG